MRAFATEIRPGVRETPATIEAAFPWIEQTRALVQPEELGGLAEELSPATADLARLIDRASELLPETDLASKCVRDVVLPAGDLVIQDEFTTGEENYKEFFYALVGIAGEGQNIDGNGMYVRFQTGGGSQQVSLGPSSTNTGELFGNDIGVPLGNRPGLSGQAAAVPARRALLHAADPGRQRARGGEVRADGRAGDERAGRPRARQAAARGRAEAVRRQAQPVRRQAPAGRRSRSEDGDPQAPARLPGHPRPADHRRRGRRP